MYRFVPNKLLKKFSRHTGNWNWSFRFSQNESKSFENVFYKAKTGIFYRNHKKFDKLKFKESINRELLKNDANNIDYEIFHETVLSILKAHVPLKKKHVSRANHATFTTKKFWKAVMKRARLRNAYLNKRTEALKAA